MADLITNLLFQEVYDLEEPGSRAVELGWDDDGRYVVVHVAVDENNHPYRTYCYMDNSSKCVHCAKAELHVMLKYGPADEISPINAQAETKLNLTMDRLENNHYMREFLENVIAREVIHCFGKSQRPLRLTLDFNSDEWEPRVRFLMGTERLYVVKNIEQEILNPAQWGDYVVQGKKQSVQVKPERFDDRSRKLYDWLVHYRYLVNGQMLHLDWEALSDLLTLVPLFPEWPIEEGQIQLPLRVEKYGDSYQLIQEEMTPSLLMPAFYLRIKEDQLLYQTISPFDYDLQEVLTATQGTLIVSVEQLHFLKYRLEEESLLYFLSNPEVIPAESMKRGCVVIDVDEHGALTVKAGREECSTLETKEDALLGMVMTIFSGVYQEEEQCYRFTDEQAEQRFLDQALPYLSENRTVYVATVVRQKRQPKPFHLTFKLGVKKDHLKLTAQSTDIPVAELDEILYSYRHNRRFHRLKNGERVVLDPKQLAQLDQVFNELDITHWEKSGIELPLQRVYQLEQWQQSGLDLKFESNVLTYANTAPLPIASYFRPLLRNYQQEGVDWLLKLRALSLGGILADDMGLGKTLQVIAYIESVQKITTAPILIVTPASLAYNWQKELKKFQATVDPVMIIGEQSQRLERIHSHPEAKVWITTYDYLRRDSAYYMDISFDTVILDEATAIKTASAKTAHAVKRLQRQYAFALSGTPLENQLAELWSLFDFIMPGYLYSYPRFRERFERPIVQQKNSEQARRLKQLIAPFILRRLKSEVVAELPTKVEETYYVTPTPAEQKIYLAHAKEAQKTVESLVDLKAERMKILALLTRLRQLCIDPRLVDKWSNGISSKLQVAVQLIKQCQANHTQVLVFSSFVGGLQLLSEALADEEISNFMLTGQDSKEARQQAVEAFQAGERTAFLISLKAGGTGLNLTAATTVIHLDPWWNPSAQNQATDRAYRIGQNAQVTVYHLIVEGTIEEGIEQLKAQKQALADEILTSSPTNSAKLSQEELMALFSIRD
ncbi:MAG: SNF2-related protein [Aerococcus sp.]|nr:SNF2-related protein [Aerococcus sp.]